MTCADSTELRFLRNEVDSNIGPTSLAILLVSVLQHSKYLNASMGSGPLGCWDCSVINKVSIYIIVFVY